VGTFKVEDLVVLLRGEDGGPSCEKQGYTFRTCRGGGSPALEYKEEYKHLGDEKDPAVLAALHAGLHRALRAVEEREREIEQKK
jgi:hypothetical protein